MINILAHIAEVHGFLALRRFRLDLCRMVEIAVSSREASTSGLKEGAEEHRSTEGIFSEEKSSGLLFSSLDPTTTGLSSPSTNGFDPCHLVPILLYETGT